MKEVYQVVRNRLKRYVMRLLKKICSFCAILRIWVVGGLLRFFFRCCISDKAKHKCQFPFDERGRLWFSRLMFAEKEKGYCPQYYKAHFKKISTQVGDRNLAAEILHVTKHRGSACLYFEEECLLPIALSDKLTFIHPEIELNICFDGEGHQIKKPVLGRYYYFKIPARSKVEIISKGREFFVGNEIKLGKKNAGPKLVLPIFIDGFGYDFLKSGSLEELMPKTHSFFSKGTIFHRCYSSGEWTLPSVASMFTGLLTQHHGMFHPKIGKPLSKQHPTLSELFQKNGYFTTQICSNWRKNPALGYVRGYDRTVYRREMDCSESVSEFLSLMEGLKEQHVFSWLTLFDLHHRFYQIPTIDVQLMSDFDLYTGKDLPRKSVNRRYDESAVKYHGLELKRIDRHLGFIYDFIEENYQNEDILVVLMSDHGQSYLSDDPHILSDKRIHVPLMVRGRGVSCTETYELVQNTDILSSLLHLAGLGASLPKTDGILPHVLGGREERSYIFAESLYPSQVYKCVFKGEEGKFVFESRDFVDKDGIFNADSVECLMQPDGGLIQGKDEAYFRRKLKEYVSSADLR